MHSIFMGQFGIVVRHRLVSRRAWLDSALALLSFSKFVVCGHCLVTLSLTVNKTLKWLSSLPVLMQESFWW